MLIQQTYPGESKSGLICPFCYGGDKRDKSFSLTKRDDGTVVYICHRAKCGRKGAVGVKGYPHLRLHQKTKEHKVFTDATVPLSQAQVDYFFEHYGLSRKEISSAGFLYVPDRGAVLQPIFDPHGRKRGQSIRKYGTEKRINIYKDPERQRDPMLSWYGPSTDGYAEKVVVVEDQLSAIKLSRFHRSVAILGADISSEGLMELYDYSLVQYLSLDKDALEKALSLERRYRNLLNFKIVPVDRDPKYWENYELKTLKGILKDE